MKELETFDSSRVMITRQLNDNHLDTKGGYLPLKRNGYCNGGHELMHKFSREKRHSASDETESNILPLLSRNVNSVHYHPHMDDSGELVGQAKVFRTLPSQQSRNKHARQSRDSAVENCAPGRPVN